MFGQKQWGALFGRYFARVRSGKERLRGNFFGQRPGGGRTFRAANKKAREKTSQNPTEKGAFAYIFDTIPPNFQKTGLIRGDFCDIIVFGFPRGRKTVFKQLVVF